MFLERFEWRIGFAVRAEMANAFEAGLGRSGPNRAYAHAHANLSDGNLLDEVEQRRVGPVEQDRGAGVGQLACLRIELDINDAEGGDGPGLRQLDLVRGR